MLPQLLLVTAAASGPSLTESLQRLASGEPNYCSKIEENTNYAGNDIRYENKSNHWFPATIGTCCASCRNSKSDPGATDECVCWVWGYNNNQDCRKGSFKDGEGCCWLKRADAQGGACQAGRSDSASQMSGHYTEGEPHEGGLPDQDSGGWTVVTIIMGFTFVGAAYNRVSPGFGRNLKSLVIDGVTFTMSPAYSPQSDYTPIKSEPSSSYTPDTDTRTTGPNTAFVRGRATPLHAAAATGATCIVTQHIAGPPIAPVGSDVEGLCWTDSHKALWIGNSARVEALLKSGSRTDLDARDTRGYTPFMVACAGGHVDVVRMLCAAGCDCTLRNDVGLVRHANPSAHICRCLTPVWIAIVGAIAVSAAP